MSDEHGYNDPESISFVGHESSPPEIVIDFAKDIWQIDLYFGREVAMIAVNATSEKEAIASAIERAKVMGFKTITVERIVATKLEVLTDGGELA